MIEKYIKFQSEINSAVEKLYADKIAFKRLTPGQLLTGHDLRTLMSIVDILKSAEAATQLLGSEHEPTMHVRDVILCEVMQNCVHFESTVQPNTVLHQFAKTSERGYYEASRRTAYCA